MSKKRVPPHIHNAHSSYGANAKRALGGRDIEANALLTAARALQDVQNNWNKKQGEVLEKAVQENRKIWVMFYDTALSAGHESGLHKTVVSLANFVFKRSQDVMAAPEAHKLSALISINREVAAGLMSKNAPQNA
jgi:flagellar protein FlaF